MYQHRVHNTWNILEAICDGILLDSSLIYFCIFRFNDYNAHYKNWDFHQDFYLACWGDKHTADNTELRRPQLIVSRLEDSLVKFATF